MNCKLIIERLTKKGAVKTGVERERPEKAHKQ